MFFCPDFGEHLCIHSGGLNRAREPAHLRPPNEPVKRAQTSPVLFPCCLPAQQASAFENDCPAHFAYHRALSALSSAVAAHVERPCGSDPLARLLVPVGGDPFILSCYSLAIFALGLHLSQAGARPAGLRLLNRTQRKQLVPVFLLALFPGALVIDIAGQ
jgi:hypothetical protein